MEETETPLYYEVALYYASMWPRPGQVYAVVSEFELDSLSSVGGPPCKSPSRAGSQFGGRRGWACEQGWRLALLPPGWCGLYLVAGHCRASVFPSGG